MPKKLEYQHPVRLADNTIVYSAGIGSVLFNPESEGQQLRPLEFSKVLHVPDLRNNLLSVLYLTRHKQFQVVISESVMSFMHSGSVLFTADAQQSNCAYLEGSTVAISPPIHDSIHVASSTLPMDTTLWHRRLCHHHYGGIEHIVKEHLVL